MLAKCQSFTLTFLCDQQSISRQAVVYMDRSSCHAYGTGPTGKIRLVTKILKVGVYYLCIDCLNLNVLKQQTTKFKSVKLKKFVPLSHIIMII